MRIYPISDSSEKGKDIEKYLNAVEAINDQILPATNVIDDPGFPYVHVLAKKRFKGNRIGAKDQTEACNNLRKRLMQGVPLPLLDKTKSMLKASLR